MPLDIVSKVADPGNAAVDSRSQADTHDVEMLRRDAFRAEQVAEEPRYPMSLATVWTSRTCSRRSRRRLSWVRLEISTLVEITAVRSS